MTSNHTPGPWQHEHSLQRPGIRQWVITQKDTTKHCVSESAFKKARAVIGKAKSAS